MNKLTKLVTVAIPLAFSLYSSIAGATNVNLGTLAAGGNGPFYELETVAFDDNYSFNFNFGPAFSSANVNIQFDDLLVGGHSIPNLAASLYDSGNNLISALAGNNAFNNILLSNGSYYLNITGTPLPAADPNGAEFGVHFEVTPVPEPETYALMLAGLGLIGLTARRRTNKLGV